MNNEELKEVFDEIITYLSKTQDKQNIFNFLRDLLSEKEILEFCRRFDVAKMLLDKKSYQEIEKKTNMSSTTIARISKFLHGENAGYKDAIERLKE